MIRLTDLTNGEIACLAIGLTSTYGILLGVILTCVVEIKTRGKALSRNEFVDVEDAKTLLHQYSEWLDVKRINPSASTEDPRTHDELVQQFISSRNEQALPMLEETADVLPIGPQVGDTMLSSVGDTAQYQRQTALEYATRWSSFHSDGNSPEAIVETAEKYLTFLQAGE